MFMWVLNTSLLYFWRGYELNAFVQFVTELHSCVLGNFEKYYAQYSLQKDTLCLQYVNWTSIRYLEDLHDVLCTLNSCTVLGGTDFRDIWVIYYLRENYWLNIKGNTLRFWWENLVKNWFKRHEIRKWWKNTAYQVLRKIIMVF